MSVLKPRPGEDGMSLQQHQHLSRTLSLDGETTAAATSMNFTPLEAMVFKRSNSVSAISSAMTQALPSRNPNFKIELPPNPPHGAVVGASGNVVGPEIPAPSNAVLSLFPGPLTPPADSPSFEVPSSSTDERLSGTPSVATAGKPVQDPLNTTLPNSEALGHPSSSSSTQAPTRTPNMNTETPNATLTPLEEAISTPLSMIDVLRAPSNSIQVVAQVLPVPLNEPEVEPPTAYHTLVRTLKSISPGYVHVHHVHPTTMTLSSPVVTPSAGAGQGQADYFDMSRVITSVTYLASPYHVQPPGGPPSPPPAPGTPTLAIPPSCAEVSLYERFIPPGSDREFLDLFGEAAPSALVDRLTELGPSGTLLFIYPTKAGADTFLRTYLNPLLDPVLRTIILNRALSSHIGPEIARMTAVPHMVSFDRLVRKLGALLRKLNQRHASTTSTAGAASTSALAPATGSTTTGQSNCKYALVHATRARAQLPRKAWERWWIQQETPRIKAATAEYYRVGKSLPEDQRISSTALAREIVEALAKRGYAPGEATGEGEGVEVGVFAIKRQ